MSNSNFVDYVHMFTPPNAMHLYLDAHDPQRKIDEEKLNKIYADSVMKQKGLPKGKIIQNNTNTTPKQTTTTSTNGGTTINNDGTPNVPTYVGSDTSSATVDTGSGMLPFILIGAGILIVFLILIS